jgi:hypothetical protein
MEMSLDLLVSSASTPCLLISFYEAAREVNGRWRPRPPSERLVVHARTRFDILLFVLNEGTIVPAQHAKRRRGGHHLFNSLRATEEFIVLTPRSSLSLSLRSVCPRLDRQHRRLIRGAITPQRKQDARESTGEGDDCDPSSTPGRELLDPRV